MSYNLDMSAVFHSKAIQIRLLEERCVNGMNQLPDFPRLSGALAGKLNR